MLANAENCSLSFRLRIVGDAMEPQYRDSDTVEFREVGRGEERLIVGRDYFVECSDGVGTFRRLKGRSAQAITLASINSRKHPGQWVIPLERIVRMAVPVLVMRAVECGGEVRGRRGRRDGRCG